MTHNEHTETAHGIPGEPRDTSARSPRRAGRDRRRGQAGAWAFHSHILNRAEASTGMFGMVIALIVE